MTTPIRMACEPTVMIIALDHILADSAIRPEDEEIAEVQMHRGIGA